jgi:hypothetical protein
MITIFFTNFLHKNGPSASPSNLLAVK